MYQNGHDGGEAAEAGGENGHSSANFRPKKQTSGPQGSHAASIGIFRGPVRASSLSSSTYIL